MTKIDIETISVPPEENGLSESSNSLENRVPVLKHVRKRDGSVVEFDSSRISSAIYKAMMAERERTGEAEGNLQIDPQRIAGNVVRGLENRYRGNEHEKIPGIEDIQGLVERNLILERMPETARGYILYRQERTQIRAQKREIPERVQNLVNESKKYFQNPLSEFVYFRSYSRWMEDEGRREVWTETVDRYINFMKEKIGDRLSDEEYGDIKSAILNQEVMPSMRLMWSSGDAATASNVTAYNCSYLVPEKTQDLGEILYILMCGTGSGFSVENQFAQKFPIVQKQRGIEMPRHVVKDTREGWADAFVAGLNAWYDGYDLNYDTSKVRPAGTKLKTMGGRSAGPEALEDLLLFSKAKILGNQKRRLSSLDIHDINCKTGEIVQMGGVRRSSLISLSDLDDLLMRGAKVGAFYETQNQRKMANNSAVYEEKPGAVEFMREWLALAESGTGERGIFNRGGLRYQLPERRLALGLEHLEKMGANPCGEIYLRDRGFCNLTEIVARPNDTRQTLERKARIASLLGTYQSMLTDFPYISSKWKENAEEERLLGVSITGQLDSRLAQDPEVERMLRQTAIDANEYYAKRFGINPSVAVTCVKPSGTVSQLVNASSGGHARWSDYYIRNVRISATDPLFHMIKDQKYPYYPEVGESMDSARTYVIPFPVKAPEGSVTRKDLNAIQQLENWKRMKENYTEHNPSVSIYVGNNEWIETAQWLHQNWDSVGGLSFFPRDDHVYKLAPFEEISKEKYQEMVGRMPKIDYSQILLYEKDDGTSGSKEYGCIGGSCEI
jgi:ribonucleoside-diphosphate reductase alpha chain